MIKNNIDVKINVSKLVDNSYDMDTFKEKLINLIVEKVTSYFEGHEYVFEKSVPINIMTKEELDKFLLSIDKQFENNVVPEWIKGFSCELGVYLVLSGNENEDLNIALHESVHYYSMQLNAPEDRIHFLEEALTTYICSQMTTGKFSKIVEDKNNNSLRTIKSLIETNENDTFANNKGYYYSFFFMKFLKNKYYKSKIIEYITDNEKFFNDLEKLEKEYREFLLEQIDYYTKK